MIGVFEYNYSNRKNNLLTTIPSNVSLCRNIVDT